VPDEAPKKAKAVAKKKAPAAPKEKAVKAPKEKVCIASSPTQPSDVGD
jgi:hypothetical protein